MRKSLHLPVVAVLLLGAAGSARALELGGAVGVTGQGDMTYRVGLGFDWRQAWWKTGRGHVGGYWDAGYTYWEGGDYAGAHSLSLSPVFVYQFAGGSIQPFVELGVGVAFFSKTRVGDKRLGSSFNFENRIGVGVRLAGGHRIGLRASHYSNAGIEKPNDGIESYALYYSHSF